MTDVGRTNSVFGLDHFREIVSRRIERDRYFDPDHRIVITRAPGRLDLMGGIADYSGSLVLQHPIKEAIFVAAQLSEDRKVRIESLTDVDALETISFDADLDEFLPDGKIGSILSARRFFAGAGHKRWAAYAAGALVVLAHAQGVKYQTGIRILIWSEVPSGKGVSSSAALEVAVMKAVVELYHEDVGGLMCRDLALLCQRVENEIVGAPCGVMDQMASACGTENSLIELVCQPAELRGTIELPDKIEIWGIDSGIRHSVAGSDYGTVRTAASMGYRMISEIAGLKIERLENGRVRINDPLWNGYLANIEAAGFEAKFSEHLPSSISGREFLEKYYGVSDPHSSVHPDRDYPVHAATAHPVHENARVQRFAQLLKSVEPHLNELGSLMYASHDSYSTCGLGSDGTNMLVDLVRSKGAEAGMYGAKITGGGSGGTVAILARKASRPAVEAIANEYHNLSGRNPYVFSGSSPGAFQFGIIDLAQSEK